MANGLAIGEQIFVPVSLLEGVGADQPSAFIRQSVRELRDRSVRIEFAGVSHWVASSKCQRNIGLLVIAVGDLESESALLDPLSKSVTQFCRLLASDDYVRYYKVRSSAELKQVWANNHRAYSHVIIIGHGNGTGVRFAVDDWQDAAQLAEVLDTRDVDPKCFVSLACQAGQASFARRFSEMKACGAFLGAFHAVHGAIASQFVQSFLVFHMLEGETTAVAFRHARERVPGSTSFRLWRDGTMA